jgi:hypothetical protein
MGQKFRSDGGLDERVAYPEAKLSRLQLGLGGDIAHKEKNLRSAAPLFLQLFGITIPLNRDL